MLQGFLENLVYGEVLLTSHLTFVSRATRCWISGTVWSTYLMLFSTSVGSIFDLPTTITRDQVTIESAVQ